MVLYRKHRPQKFGDIVGQEHIVKTLTNALAGQKFGHGYLFAGSKGSGKTTMARIFAKALNCTGRKLAKESFEPCNRCTSCKEIMAGKSLDLIEIDAASNRGIDEIRELREKIRFAPTSSHYKVYIIDEVHMLTKEAFNALLKTLEEPPKHAIFIMATTEPQKVLPTILSRVQRFDFHKATIEELEKLLERISRQENIKIDENALKLLAQLSFGSYRDSLSLLEQVSSLRQTAASKITLEQVQEILGLAQEKSIFDFIRHLANKDRKLSFELVSKLFFQGVDLENFTIKLIEILRKMALWRIGEDQLFDLTREQQNQVKELAGEFELDELMGMVAKFISAIPQIKAANLPQLPLEMVVFELTSEIRNTNQYENTKMSRGNAPSETPVSSALRIPAARREEIRKPMSRMARVADSEGHPEAISKKGNFSQNLWLKIISEAKAHNHSLAALLKDAAIAGTEDDTITLAFKFKFHANMVANRKNTQVIESIITKLTGTSYRISCVVSPELVIKAPVDADEELLNGAKEVFEVEE